MPFKTHIALLVLAAALPGFVASAVALNAAEIEKGFVFIDGEFLPGPYAVQSVPLGVTINGRVVALVAMPSGASGMSSMQTSRRNWRGEGNTQFISEGQLPADERRPRGDFRGESRRLDDSEAPAERRPSFDDRRPPIGERRFPDRGFPGFERRERPFFPSGVVDARRVSTCLEGDGILVSFTGHSAVIIDHNQAIGLLRVLAGSAEVATALSPLLKDRPEAEREQWNKWLADYTAPEPLLTRVNLLVENHEQLLAENLADVAATRRLSALAYPLTVLGMVLSVYALGHLLSSPPKGAPRTPSSPRNLKFSRAACISLGLVVLLSALDLTWTVLASQAGQMRELNPLGSRMIEDPLLLTLFKSSATFGGCGLLLVLRRHHQAQWAAWWMCLVLTVLTFRWLVLNSMFVV